MKFSPSLYPSSAMRCTNAIHCGAVLGCTLAVPTRSGLIACCARDAIGHAIALPIVPRNCRLRMYCPRPAATVVVLSSLRKGLGRSHSILRPFADHAMHLFEMLAH